jgi:hypothetical protein
MDITTHHIQDKKIAEIISPLILIQTAAEGADILGNLYYQDFNGIIVHHKNITPEFFNLSTGIAGELLQKFSNYRMRLAIVGDFSQYTSKSMRDFIFESNKTGHISFLPSVSEALKKLAN